MKQMTQEVEMAMYFLGEMLDAMDLAEGSPASNCGARFHGERFAMRAYCWCDGGREGHDPECPPNFEHYGTAFRCDWYKHAGRGNRQSRDIGPHELASIVRDCLAEMLG